MKHLKFSGCRIAAALTGILAPTLAVVVFELLPYRLLSTPRPSREKTSLEEVLQHEIDMDCWRVWDGCWG